MSDSTATPPITDLYRENRAKLLENQAEWNRRLSAIRADRGHTQVPLDPDFEEQAVQRENDETLDALDVRGRAALAAIDAALARLDAGSYGWCVSCRAPIPAGRLAAAPTADRCMNCAA